MDFSMHYRSQVPLTLQYKLVQKCETVTLLKLLAWRYPNSKFRIVFGFEPFRSRCT